MAYLASAIECYFYAREHMTGKPRFGERHELLAFVLVRFIKLQARIDCRYPPGPAANRQSL